MPELFGKTYTRDELRPYLSDVRQVAGIRLSEMADGRARGTRVADIYTGSGLHFQVLLDRAMDIGAASYRGIPLAWLHPAGAGPELYEPQGYGWTRTFGGGLLTTCGLTHFGQPEEDMGERLGLHGRISHQRAENVRVREEWRGDDFILEIDGQARQSVLAGENILLTRKISTWMGSSQVTIEDRVRNDSFRPTPLMILYHCNFGFPLVSPNSELIINDEEAHPRDEAARAGFAEHLSFSTPQKDYAEQVFFHKPHVNSEGHSQASIVNKTIGIGANIRYRATELPYLGQWKMMAQGDYVCALEPANYWETPRQRLREEGRLRYLEPGEEVNFQVMIEVAATGNLPIQA